MLQSNNSTWLKQNELVCHLYLVSYKARYPGDNGGDSHGHGHDHGDVHNEEDMDNLSGPVHDFGLHDRHEDSHAG